LAFTLSINRTAAGSRQAVQQFQHALELFEELERNWPDRHQPVGLCLRNLAHSAFREHNLKEAEQLWRQAIARGEAFLLQQPGNVEARSGLCWACGEVAEAILLRSNERAGEAEPILKTGLEHSAILRQENPDSAQARDVEAFLHFCLARCYCRSDRIADATRYFQLAVDEIEALCAEFPWNQQYWDSVKYFQRETVNQLQAVDRPDDARQALSRMVDWAQATGPKLPADSLAQGEMQQCRASLVALLRSTRQEHDADELERTLPRQQ
jgi:tetratricopeptide (TPR) repeat protein